MKGAPGRGWEGRRVGIALGGGGARGVAHALALEAIDDAGIRPRAIAGTSMGAIVGALYASGQGGRQIRERVEQNVLATDGDLRGAWARGSTLLRWLAFVRPEMGGGGFLRADAFLRHQLEQIGVSTFEELQIPLRVVATDFWTGDQVVIESGELLPALKASMAIPGIFAPVTLGGRTLVDGGIANNLPFDLLRDRCDITVAVDVAPTRPARGDTPPGILDAILGMFDLLLEKDLRARLERSPPDLYVHPEIVDVRVLDFDKIGSVLEQARPAMDRLREELARDPRRARWPWFRGRIGRGGPRPPGSAADPEHRDSLDRG